MSLKVQVKTMMVQEHIAAYEFTSVLSLLLESGFPLSTVASGKTSVQATKIVEDGTSIAPPISITRQPAGGRIVRDIVVAMPIRSSRETER
jgi:hypothetical protein